MLPTFWQTHYQLLLDNFQALQNLVNSEALEINQVKTDFEQLKAHFYEHIMPFKAEDANLNSIGRWQSLQIELHRLMRLVETDMLFLQSSRQGNTRQSRLQQISDRLQAMMQFCQEILKM